MEKLVRLTETMIFSLSIARSRAAHMTYSCSFSCEKPFQKEFF